MKKGVWAGLTGLVGVVALPAFAVTPEVRREKTVNFAIDQAYLDTGAVQFFYQLDLRNGHPDSGDSFDDGNAFSTFLPLDTHGFWQSRGRDQYYVMMSEVAYVVEKDISTFSREQTLDVKYMNAVAPAFEVRLVGGNHFQIPGVFSLGIPSADFTLDYMTAQDSEMANQPLLDPALGKPDVMVVQYNYNFGTIMAARTSKMAMAFSYHYSLGAGRTLVLNYSLGYLYNVPPFFLGGIARVRTEAESHALDVIVNLRNYKP